MACAHRTRAAQETQLLPTVVATEQQSLVVVKKLLAIAVSNISYLRGLFPEEAYGTKHVEDMKVMILREDRRCPGANQIVQWMQGCFDAVQRKYLRVAVLCIYTDAENSQRVTEFYQFKIRYTTKGPQLDLKSNNNSHVATMACGDTKKACILMLRKLYTLMQNLGPLPDNVYLNMKLAFCNEVTPHDYQPPGFREGVSDIMMFRKQPIQLTMGEVATPFHTLGVNVITERDRMEQGHTIEDMEQSNNVNSGLKEGAVQITFLENMEVCEEITVASQEDTPVTRISDIEVELKRTRSGRVFMPAPENPSAKSIAKKPPPEGNKITSRFEFPNSQDVPSSAPKRRKFSEPKERY